MPKILLINPLSAPKYLSEQLKDHGIYAIALFTEQREQFNNYFRPDTDYFDQQIYMDKTVSIDEIISKLPTQEFDYILNGTDESLIITESIINKLKPDLANATSLINSRTDKFNMQEQFKICNLPYIKQKKISLLNLENLDLNKLWFPCFIKPVGGNASIGIAVCNSPEELLMKLKEAKKITTAMNNAITEYIIQEVIVGEEIFVDTFSVNGQHFISSVQKIHKEQINCSTAYYRYCTLVYDTALWDMAAALVRNGLDACGFKNGLNHTELFVLKDNGLKIIEINTRISGSKGMHNHMAKLQNINSQTDLLVKYLNRQTLDDSLLSNVKSYVMLLYLYNFADKPTSDINSTLSRLSLKSRVEVIMSGSIGVIPESNKNLTNVDSLVLLQHMDKNIVETEARQIFELETSGALFN